MGTDKQPYQSVIRADLEFLMSESEKWRNDYKLSKAIGKTDTLCWLFMQCVFELVRAILFSIDEGNLLSCRIIARSAIDHLVDLHYIGMTNNEETSKFFINHHKVLLYRLRHFLTDGKEEIPRIEEEYKAHVFSVFENLVSDSNKLGKDKDKLIKFADVDKYIRKRFASSWLGYSFNTRLEKVQELIEKNSYNNTQISKDDFSPLLALSKYFYQVECMYIHPTPYSVVPHFDPKNYNYEWSKDYTAEPFMEQESYCFLMIESAITAFSVSSHVAGEFRTRFLKLGDKRSDLKGWIKSYYRPNQ